MVPPVCPASCGLSRSIRRTSRTISDFRKRHLKALGELFLQVLKLCETAGLVKLGHVALDGTKIKANASKHKAIQGAHSLPEERSARAAAAKRLTGGARSCARTSTGPRRRCDRERILHEIAPAGGSGPRIDVSRGPFNFWKTTPNKVVFGCASCAPRQGEIGFAFQL
jgi:hypothetical protein